MNHSKRSQFLSEKKKKRRKKVYAFKRRTRGCILICSSSGSENNHKDGFVSFLFFDPQCETSLWIGFSDVTDPAKGISLSFSPSKREKEGEGIKEDEVKTEEK